MCWGNSGFSVICQTWFYCPLTWSYSLPLTLIWFHASSFVPAVWLWSYCLFVNFHYSLKVCSFFILRIYWPLKSAWLSVLTFAKRLDNWLVFWLVCWTIFIICHYDYISFSLKAEKWIRCALLPSHAIRDSPRPAFCLPVRACPDVHMLLLSALSAVSVTCCWRTQSIRGGRLQQPQQLQPASYWSLETFRQRYVCMYCIIILY